MIRVRKARNLLWAPSSLLEIWTRTAHHHPGQRSHVSRKNRPDKSTHSSHVQTIRKSLQSERHPQKPVGNKMPSKFDLQSVGIAVREPFECERCSFGGE
jgi:hypothetical protein